jgi:hypothetical protein
MDIIKELASMIYKLERTSYDQSKSDPEFKKMTPKQFERNIAERIKALKQQLNELKK